jgi:hypothetical protein
MNPIIRAAMTTEAIGRLRASPPNSSGLSRKPTEPFHARCRRWSWPRSAQCGHRHTKFVPRDFPHKGGIKLTALDLHLMEFELRELLCIAVWLACVSGAIAQTNPRAPCDDVQPGLRYAQPGRAPSFNVWSEGNPGKQWTPPACTGWTPKDGTLVAIASQFRYMGNVYGLLSRFGGISTLRGLRYWSITDNGWQTLITDATALDGPDLARPRADFIVAEMRAGADLYYTETSANIVVAVENVTPVQIFMLTVFGLGDLQSVNFLTRKATGLWSYYGLARSGVVIRSLIGAKEESYVYRALALYSHFTDTPIDPVRP